MSAALTVVDLCAGYGRIDVLHDVSLQVEHGALCAIVGANGAGKTTLLRALSGLQRTRSGSVSVAGIDRTNGAAHTLVRAGLVHVPEGRRMLADMSVEENLLVAAAVKPGSPTPRLASLYARFPILHKRRTLAAGSLSGGEQQMLAIARGLACEPQVLLLDEPSMGLAPKFVAAVFAIIREERARGTSIVLVEQNARRALAIADYAYVLERGRIVLEGPGSQLAADERVTHAYLGASAMSPVGPRTEP